MLRTTDPRVSRRGLSALRNERNIAMTTTLEAIRKYQLQESLPGLRGLACRRLMLPTDAPPDWRVRRRLPGPSAFEPCLKHCHRESRHQVHNPEATGHGAVRG